MKWTSETPTEPGWYWCRYVNCKPEIVKVYASDYHRGLTVARLNLIGDERIDLFQNQRRRGMQWAGPIPMPEVEA